VTGTPVRAAHLCLRRRCGSRGGPGAGHLSCNENQKCPASNAGHFLQLEGDFALAHIGWRRFLERGARLAALATRAAQELDVSAVISYDARGLPSLPVQTRGPPVVLCPGSAGLRRTPAALWTDIGCTSRPACARRSPGTRWFLHLGCRPGCSTSGWWPPRNW